jgi:hypothetical protein
MLAGGLFANSVEAFTAAAFGSHVADSNISVRHRKHLF